MTLPALGLLAVQVSSMQSVLEPRQPAQADPFKLKNPNAFDPARRRSVKAMKVPRESVEHMAFGIDAAEAELPQDTVAVESIDDAVPVAAAPQLSAR